MFKKLQERLLFISLLKNSKLNNKHVKALFIIGLAKKLVLVAIIWLIN